MKQILLGFTILCFSISCYSQTTLEEYNYITKGIKIQKEAGLDMKKGYEMTLINTVASTAPTSESNDTSYVVSNGRTTDVRGARLYAITKSAQDGKPKKIAAYLILYKYNDADFETLCVPHPNSIKSVKDAFWNSLYKSPTDNNNVNRLQLIVSVLAGSLKW